MTLGDTIKTTMDEMIISKLRTALTVMMLAVATIGLTACNTVEGAGKDIESAGDAIEDATDEFAD
ncbi:MAG: hypothetical protein Alpg2KO_20400 [Alphaproteobacteria bacterium]